MNVSNDVFAFLFVDASNLYFRLPDGFYSMPKGGGSPVRISEAGAQIAGATIRGGDAFWIDIITQGSPGEVVAVKSAPVQGGSVSLVQQFATQLPVQLIAATTSSVYVTTWGSPPLYIIPPGGAPDGGVPSVMIACAGLAADGDVVYCSPHDGSVTTVGSDGSMVTLGAPASNAEVVAFDASNVYWGNYSSGGGVFSVPKQGGTPVVLASDPAVQAVAVDDGAVYWESQGSIKRIGK